MANNNRYPDRENPENRYRNERIARNAANGAVPRGRDVNRERQMEDDSGASYEEEAARRRAAREMREIRRNEKRLDTVKKGLLVVIIILAVVLAVMVAMLFKTKKKDNRTSGRTDKETVSETSRETQPESFISSSEETAGSAVSSASALSEAGETSEASALPEQQTVMGPPVYTVSSEQLYSDAAYMVRVSDGFEVIDKLSTMTIYPASMTKLMTALLVVENIPDLNRELTVTWEIIDRMYEQEASVAGFEGGETVPVIDLLYGLLLPSGAEASDLLAEEVGGNVDNFVAMMNERAASLGMTGTHFSNTTGLHSDSHYSTCRDIAILLKKVIENPTLKNIISTPSYVCTPTEQHPDGLSLVSTLFYNMSGNVMKNGAVIMGGKTGTTDEAGKCLASFGMYKDEEYVLVSAAAWEYGEYGFPNIEDAQAVYGGMTL